MGSLGHTRGNRCFQLGKQPGLMGSGNEKQSTSTILPVLFRCRALSVIFFTLPSHVPHGCD